MKLVNDSKDYNALRSLSVWATEAELKQIQVPTTIKAWCPTVPRAIDLQIQRTADYESLTLNVFRYSYLSGLDGEVPGDESMKAAGVEKPKNTETAKDALAGGLKERPEGTGQLDYVRALATRIQDEGEGAKAIGILGSDPYDALLILKALQRGREHGYGISVLIRQTSKDVLQVEQGSLYPALYRLENKGWIAAEWGTSENNRKARYYKLTGAGRKQLTAETEHWSRLTEGINLVLGAT